MSPQASKRLITWGVVAGSLAAIGGAIIMAMQFVRPAFAYATLPARTATIVTGHAVDIADLKVWRRKKDRRDWKTRWYLEQIAKANGIPMAPDPRDRDLEDE